jgi:hypothetical protein
VNEDLLSAVRTASNVEEIAEIFERFEPPSDPRARTLLREQLLAALDHQVRSPARLVDQWFATSGREATARPWRPSR